MSDAEQKLDHEFTASLMGVDICKYCGATKDSALAGSPCPPAYRNQPTHPVDGELREKLSSLQFEIGDQYITLGDAPKILDLIMDDIDAHLQAAVQNARHDEHFKTHCLNCGKYNKIDRPEDERVCQCE